MATSNISIVIFFLLSTILLSCNSGHEYTEQDKIFHATGASGGIGGIYFALYKNHKYQVCETGGLSEKCYDGDYTIAGDTIILNNLSKDSYIKNNRLLICRYNQQDSAYWQWKYPAHVNDWSYMRESDLSFGNIGDVHQIDINNTLLLDTTYYFVIRLDSLKNYR
ncbi:MAG: hypothetical protein IPP93_17535 [Chitinophagaceae bacterium]|nr:hypothetical protein [Chitinophagaceae bacterium]